MDTPLLANSEHSERTHCKMDQSRRRGTVNPRIKDNKLGSFYLRSARSVSPRHLLLSLHVLSLFPWASCKHHSARIQSSSTFRLIHVVEVEIRRPKSSTQLRPERFIGRPMNGRFLAVAYDLLS